MLSCHAGIDPNAKQRLPSGHWKVALDAETLQLPRTAVCFQKIEGNDRLGYNLPEKPNMLAGQILSHCFNAVDRILRKQEPCIYKVGFTHCPYWRFFNDLYGYFHEKDAWEFMTIIYASHETVSGAFIEAALIKQHKGFLHELQTYIFCAIYFWCPFHALSNLLSLHDYSM